MKMEQPQDPLSLSPVSSESSLSFESEEDSDESTPAQGTETLIEGDYSCLDPLLTNIGIDEEAESLPADDNTNADAHSLPNRRERKLCAVALAGLALLALTIGLSVGLTRKGETSKRDMDALPALAQPSLAPTQRLTMPVSLAAPTTTPTATSTRDPSECLAIANGTVPVTTRAAAKAEFSLSFELILTEDQNTAATTNDETESSLDSLDQLSNTIVKDLQNQVAPQLAGCDAERDRRRYLKVGTTAIANNVQSIQNVVFENSDIVKKENCNDNIENAVCYLVTLNVQVFVEQEGPLGLIVNSVSNQLASRVQAVQISNTKARIAPLKPTVTLLATTTLPPAAATSSPSPSPSPSQSPSNPSGVSTTTPTISRTTTVTSLPSMIDATTDTPSSSPSVVTALASDGPQLPTSGNIFATEPNADSPSFSPSLTSSDTPSIDPTVLSANPSLEPSNSPSAATSITSPSYTPSSPPFTPMVSFTPSTLADDPTAQSIIPSTILSSIDPSIIPSIVPSSGPSNTPSTIPTLLLSTPAPSTSTLAPTPTPNPSISSSSSNPSIAPSATPTVPPFSAVPSPFPSTLPPSQSPSSGPVEAVTKVPSNQPSFHPSQLPTRSQTDAPSMLEAAGPPTSQTVFNRCSQQQQGITGNLFDAACSDTIETSVSFLQELIGFSEANQIIKDVINTVFAPLGEVTSILLDQEGYSGQTCAGDFQALQIVAADPEEGGIELCSELPLSTRDGDKWSQFAASFSLPAEAAQAACGEDIGALTISACFAVSTCDGVYPSIAFVADDGLFSCLAASANSATEGVAGAVAYATDVGLTPVGFGFSMTNAFDIPISFFDGSNLVPYSFQSTLYDRSTFRFESEKIHPSLEGMFELKGTTTRGINIYNPNGIPPDERSTTEAIAGFDANKEGDFLDQLLQGWMVETVFRGPVEFRVLMSAIPVLSGFLRDIELDVADARVYMSTGRRSVLLDDGVLRDVGAGFSTFFGDSVKATAVQALAENILGGLEGILNLLPDAIPNVGAADMLGAIDLSQLGDSDEDGAGITVTEDLVGFILNIPLTLLSLGSISLSCSAGLAKDVLDTDLKCRVRFNDEISDYFIAAAKDVGDGLLWVVQEADETFQETGKVISAGFQSVGAELGNVFSPENVQDTSQKIQDGVLSITGPVGEALNDFANGIGDVLGDLFSCQAAGDSCGLTAGTVCEVSCCSGSASCSGFLGTACSCN